MGLKTGWFTNLVDKFVFLMYFVTLFLGAHTCIYNFKK